MKRKRKACSHCGKTVAVNKDGHLYFHHCPHGACCAGWHLPSPPCPQCQENTLVTRAKELEGAIEIALAKLDDAGYVHEDYLTVVIVMNDLHEVLRGDRPYWP